MAKYIFVIIGVGGIGGNVARDLPKLIINTKHKMMLVDGDTVEKKNCVRQPFQTQDVGENKARVLSRKINSFYPLKCTYLDGYITACELQVLLDRHIKSGYVPVLIGAVDNDATRELIEEAFNSFENAILIDGANGEYEGNVYCCYRDGGKQYGKKRSDIYPLKKDINPGTIGCEEQIARGSLQFLITNNKVASVMLEYIYEVILNDFNTSSSIPKGVTKIERFKTLYY